jgi:hypothetical protein
MKIISHFFLMLYVSSAVARMRPSDAIDFLNAAIKLERRKRHSERAVKFLEAQKLKAEQRFRHVVANATLDHLSTGGT